MSDRKYRHQGYQDGGGYGSSKSKSSGQGRPQGFTPEPQCATPKCGHGRKRIEGAPRGRTAGGFGPEVFKCNKCGQQRIGLDEPTFEEVCMKCGADLHTCGNCRFFDTTTSWECRAEIKTRITAKHTRNECTLFSPKIVRDLSADKAGKLQSPDDARKAFDALFNKK